MRREPHENVATVLVDPALLPDLELELVELDLWVWPVRSAPICVDGPRTAFQVRRRLVEAQRGAWPCPAAGTGGWAWFGARGPRADAPLPWAAHRALWDVLDAHADGVRFHRRLGGVQPLVAPVERRPAS